VANRKQRRRREKEKRHDYDVVEIDAEGNETVLRSSELRPEDEPRKSSTSRKTSRSGRVRGVAQPPSWKRVLKRGALFAPIFFATVLLLGGKSITIAGAILNSVLLIAVFVPFSYFMDRFLWRSQQKRLAKTRGT
jgi:hypothetical protein